MKRLVWVIILIVVFVLLLVFLLIGYSQLGQKYVQINCASDEDCVKNSCCHATGCVAKINAPNCSGIFCSQDCRPGTLDCGGKCLCVNGKCEAKPR